MVVVVTMVVVMVVVTIIYHDTPHRPYVDRGVVGRGSKKDFRGTVPGEEKEGRKERGGHSSRKYKAQ